MCTKAGGRFVRSDSFMLYLDDKECLMGLGVETERNCQGYNFHFGGTAVLGTCSILCGLPIMMGKYFLFLTILSLFLKAFPFKCERLH